MEKQLYEIKIALERAEMKLDGVITQTDDHEKRMRALESKSGARWEGIVSDMIKLCIATAIGYFLAR